MQQANFHDYPMMRINEMPVVETYILDSGEAPGGLGEPGVPPVAPALCNAIFALTGKRIRRLPIRPGGAEEGLSREEAAARAFGLTPRAWLRGAAVGVAVAGPERPGWEWGPPSRARWPARTWPAARASGTGTTSRG